MTPPHASPCRRATFATLSTGPRACPYCSIHRRRVLALVDETLTWDGQLDRDAYEKWKPEFDHEAKRFREHREECNENR